VIRAFWEQRFLVAVLSKMCHQASWSSPPSVIASSSSASESRKSQSAICYLSFVIALKARCGFDHAQVNTLELLNLLDLVVFARNNFGPIFGDRGA